MKEISRADAVRALVDDDMDSILSGSKEGRQYLREILMSGSPEYDMLEPEELEELLADKFDETYKVI